MNESFITLLDIATYDSRSQYTMLHDASHAAPHHHFGSKWSRTGGMRRAPTDQTCLDILGGVTPGYSVAIAFPLYEV